MQKLAFAFACLICTCGGVPVPTSRSHSIDQVGAEALARILLAQPARASFIASGAGPCVREGCPSFTRARPAVLSARHEGPSGMSRRGVLAAVALASQALAANAYDEAPPAVDLKAREKIAAENRLLEEANEKEIKGWMTKFQQTKTAQEFGDVADEFSLYILGKVKWPRGPNIKAARDIIIDAYQALPTKNYKCKPTRTNNGICKRPGPPADKAYDAVIDVMRNSNMKEQKSGLISDGVSTFGGVADPFDYR
mmetsp:Transcript_70180/g.121519  ORF Transcript_70180/g.121519 Transcript_70180/m.121519 type:complete len:253 (-) Transcript_70180:96-854(-)